MWVYAVVVVGRGRWAGAGDLPGGATGVTFETYAMRVFVFVKIGTVESRRIFGEMKMAVVLRLMMVVVTASC